MALLADGNAGEKWNHSLDLNWRTMETAAAPAAPEAPAKPPPPSGHAPTTSLHATATASSPPAPPPPTAWRPHWRPVGVGLRNQGNSCFMAATLQALTHCPPLAAEAEAEEAEGASKSLLASHIRAALDPASPDPLSPTAVFTALPSLSKHLHPGRQEDAHEFLRALLAPAEERLFSGALRSRVICSACSAASDTRDPFLDIAMDVPRCGGGGASIHASLASFCAAETLRGADAYTCGACGATCAAARKRFSIVQAPELLCLVLKRFEGAGGTKLGAHVAFTQRLDLGTPVLAADEAGAAPTPATARYGLAAVVVHSGPTARCGHYHAFVRGARGAWWRADDARTTRAAWADVAAAAAYMLFYVKDGVCGVEPGAGASPARPTAAPLPFAGAAAVPLSTALAPPPPPASPWRAAGRAGLAPFATAEPAGASPPAGATPPSGGQHAPLPPPPRHLTRLTPPPPPPRVFTSVSAAKRTQAGFRSRGAMLLAAATGASGGGKGTPGSTPGSARRARAADDLAHSVEKRLRPASG